MLIASTADERMRQDADRALMKAEDIEEAQGRYPWLDLADERERLAREAEAQREAEETRQAVAKSVHHPFIRNAALGAGLGAGILGRRPDDVASAKLMIAECKKVRDSDLGLPTDILTSQAMTLDALFTEMLRRAAVNVGEFPDAVEHYMRMAMKAQAQCRTTIEALGKITRGGEQIVKHVHIDNRGGQAVVTDTVQSGGTNAREVEQPHATLVDAHVAALPGQDPFGRGLPIGGDEERQVSHARRNVAGRSDR